MKISIDVSDFYIDETGDIEPVLKYSIINEAVSQIKKHIEKQIEDNIVREIKNQVEQAYRPWLNTAVKEFIEKGTFSTGQYEKKEVTVQQFMKMVFEGNAATWINPKEHIQKLCQQFVKEMTERVDYTFATQMVIKMKEAGFLKPEIANALLTDSPAT